MNPKDTAPSNDASDYKAPPLDEQPDTHTTVINNAPARQGLQPLTVAFIVIIMVLLCSIFMLNMNGNLFKNKNTQPSSYSTTEARNAQLRADLNAERVRQGLPPLPEDATTAQSAADRIQRDATTLAALASQWQTILQEKDTRMRDLEGQIASHSTTTQGLYKQITDLQNKLNRAGDAETLLAAKRAELARAKRQLKDQQDQLAALQNRPSNEEMTRLRKLLDASVAANGKLQTELDKLRLQMQNTIDRKKYDELVAEMTKLRPENNKLRYEIQSLRAQLDRARLFIEAKDLPAEASRLFARLKTLEEANPQQLQSAYQNIGQTLNAKIIHRQSFATGSSQITFDRESSLRDRITKSQNPNAFYLVVGYASKSGGATDNKELSAKRATTTASVVNLLKASGQQVRAVYLGETKRFSAAKQTENQICEVWEIKR